MRIYEPVSEQKFAAESCLEKQQLTINFHYLM